MTNAEALEMITQAAEDRADGHFSIWKFTTNWKASLGTRGPRAHFAVPAFPTLGEAVSWAIEQHR